MVPSLSNRTPRIAIVPASARAAAQAAQTAPSPGAARGSTDRGWSGSCRRADCPGPRRRLGFRGTGRDQRVIDSDSRPARLSPRAQNFFNNLRRLQSSDGRRQSVQDAGFRAVRDKALRRLLRKQAAGASGISRHPPSASISCGLKSEMWPSNGRGRRIPGASWQIAGIADEIAGGEVVGAVGDDVIAGDDSSASQRRCAGRMFRPAHAG